MFYLGIDIGKNTHVASLIDSTCKTIFKAFSFSNTSDGGQSLLEIIKQKSLPVVEIEVGMEATGHYWLSAYSFLVERGFVVHVINPLSKQMDGEKVLKFANAKLM